MAHDLNVSVQARAPKQRRREPVAWYVTGCGRVRLDENEASNEISRHIGGRGGRHATFCTQRPQVDSVLEGCGAVDY